MSSIEAKGGKRELGIPSTQDRLIQQGIGQVLVEIVDPEFSEHSYGYHHGRSAHDAVRAMKEYMVEGNDWVIDIDIKGFFENINHDVLMRKASLKVSDKRVLKLVADFIPLISL